MNGAEQEPISLLLVQAHQVLLIAIPLGLYGLQLADGIALERPAHQLSHLSTLGGLARPPAPPPTDPDTNTE